MKLFVSIGIFCTGFLFPQMLFAAQIAFSIAPNTVPGDTAVIVDVILIPQKGESINAVEGRIGILGEGAEAVTDVVIESGGSLFSLWPVPPAYEDAGKIIRFTGGSPDGNETEGKIMSLRLFSDDTQPVTVSWLGGSAYRDDGLGSPVGISSRSITFSPHRGAPNKIRSTSEDTTPPYIHSINVSHDVDVFDNQYFLSVHATDDSSGISHYEVIEDGEVSRVENGPYLLRNQAMEHKLHVTVYDKAGNSISVKYPEEKNMAVVPTIIVAVFICIGIFVRYRILLRRANSRSHTVR